jgi:hypothetical protein
MYKEAHERRYSHEIAVNIRMGHLLVVAIFLGAALLFWVIPSVMMTKDDAKRVAMRARLRWITFGLHEYYVLNHSYPPNRMEVEAVAGGDTLQSWRALLLPMMTSSQIAAKYDIHRPWDDAQNLAAASTIENYSNFAGGSSTSIFLTNDACLIKPGQHDETPVDAILLVSTPKRSELWSTPSELSATELWSAVREYPTLVMIGLSSGEIVRLCDIVSSEEECRDVLNYGRLTEEQRSVYQLRIASSRDGRAAK